MLGGTHPQNLLNGIDPLPTENAHSLLTFFWKVSMREAFLTKTDGFSENKGGGHPLKVEASPRMQMHTILC